MSATRANPIPWNAVESYSKGENQTDASFEEQKLAIRMNENAFNGIETCSKTYVKNVGIHGVPGSGKTHVQQYSCLNAIAKGLNVAITSLMSKRNLNLGGKAHIHSFFKLGRNRKNTVPFRIAEKALIHLLRNGVNINVLRQLDVLFIDEAGILSAELLSIIDIILRRIRQNNLPWGGVLLMVSLDNCQFGTITGKPFLVSSLILTCFQMVKFRCSVRASTDKEYQRVQDISRMSAQTLIDNPALVQEFADLVGRVFTFVPSWDQVDKKAMRLYARKNPAREAVSRYQEQVEAEITATIGPSHFHYSEARDTQINKYSQSNATLASERSSSILDAKVKEPRKLLLFVGGIYEFTFNNNNSNNLFSQSQICMLLVLPSLEDILIFASIRVLAAPKGVDDVSYDPSKTEDDYKREGWSPRLVGVCPESVHYLGNDMQGFRKQYGLKHHVTCTIHASMGDTLFKVALQVSDTEDKFKLWLKSQVVVGISRTKIGLDTIFVGVKEDIIRALCMIILQRTHWSEYEESALNLITINNNIHGEVDVRVFQPQESFPFRIRELELPNCMTGFVYLLISRDHPTEFYVGECQDLPTRLRKHNSGNGCNSTGYQHAPYAVFAYICGFDCNESLRLHVEKEWKHAIGDLIKNAIRCRIQWALAAQRIVRRINNSSNFPSVSQHQLRLVILFDPKGITK